MRYLEARFWPDVPVFEELLRLSRACGMASRERYASGRLHWMLHVADAETIAEAAREVAEYMDVLGQPELAALYRSWLAARGGGA